MSKPRIFFSCTESTYQAFLNAAEDDVRKVNDWAKAALEIVAESGLSIKELREALDNKKPKGN